MHFPFEIIIWNTKVFYNIPYTCMYRINGIPMMRRWNGLEGYAMCIEKKYCVYAIKWSLAITFIKSMPMGCLNSLIKWIDWLCVYHAVAGFGIQRCQKVTSLVARSLRGRCAEHLRRIRGCDARIRRESVAFVTQMLRAKCAYDVRHVSRVSCKCCAHNKGCYFWTPL
jgi:hypothetical protein